MKITISPRAEKQLKKIPKADQIAVARKTRLLVSSLMTGEEKLSGFKNIYRVRIGNYRLIYRKTESEIYIILIGHRKDIYDLLTRFLG